MTIMKVSVITRHAINNYGSLLQAYATQLAIEKLGYEAEILDYVRKDEQYENMAQTQLTHNRRWNRNFLTRAVYLMWQKPEYVESGKKFEQMQRQYLKLSNRYSDKDILKVNPPVADVYCTGSDQVWGPVGTEKYDPVYFWNFLPASRKKIAYAASFGRTEFDDTTVAVYKELLKSYDSVCVREKSAMEILHQLKITSGEQVLDPTLLITDKEWINILGDKRVEEHPYILLYTLGNTSYTDQFARSFAKKKKMPLIRVTAARHWRTRGSKNVLLPDLGEFVSYIRHASYMITNSFHGTALALNCGTQFVDILPGITQTRNVSILELVGLKNRIITDFSDFSVFDNPIDFGSVQKILESERKKSFAILLQMLKSV